MGILKSLCGKYDILVDDDDLKKIYDFSEGRLWEARYFTGSKTPYVVLRKTILENDIKKRKQYFLHRFILDDPKGHVDHINHDTLDNRKSNLREVSRSQNMKNRTSSYKGTSKHLGVYFCKDKKLRPWRVSIKPENDVNKHIGYYDNQDSAGYAYNIAAKVIHGEYANYNNVEVPKDYVKIKKDVENRLLKYGIL